MEHTPLPWKRCSANEGKCSCGLIWSLPADCTVASAHSIKDGEGPTLEQSLLNADFIVRAVNCHDELLEACKAMASHGLKGKLPDGRLPYDMVIAAIAKAQA